MKLDPNEQRLGYIWFAGAGTFAIILSLFLYCTNVRLHASTGEQVKGATLNELRVAQTSLASHVSDPRMNPSGN